MTTLDEIRARLAKANRFGPNWTKELYNHAPTDLAYLLGEVERLQGVALRAEDRDGVLLTKAVERAEKAEQERDTALTALINHCIVEEYDYPGDAPEVCGWKCTICGMSDIEAHTIEHKRECPLAVVTPSERESTP
jgi:hypothetical protein